MYWTSLAPPSTMWENAKGGQADKPVPGKGVDYADQDHPPPHNRATPDGMRGHQ